MVLLPSGTPSLPTRRKWVYCLIAALLFIGAVEIIGRIILAISDARPDSRAGLPWYARRDWGPDYWREFAQQRMRFEPHIGWRRRDFVGKHINIRGGERVVVPEGPEGVTVWCFGGSTLWGTGARDAHTIPSYLAQLSAEAGLPIRVRNLGETGWVSTQELIQLILHCRSHDTPDIALFYDGLNDVYSAMQRGRADGATQNCELWEAYLDTGVDPKRHWLRKMATVRLTRAVLRRIGMSDPTTRSAIAGFSEAQREELAAGVARVYLENQALIQLLAEQSQFDALFFWQPIVTGQEGYETSERSAAPDFDPALFDLFERSRKAVMAAGEGTIDLSRAMGPSPPDGFFIDSVHLNEDGNAAIARAMFEHLRPIILRRLNATP